jgi:prepilin-type N-terminal cleavage/methylation domain-containing protein
VKTTLRQLRFSKAFTLIELMAVVAIMAIVFGLFAMSLSQLRGPTVQLAANQVASGLSLARQIAIAQNTEARFVISGMDDSFMPEEPYRYWTIISSNRGGNNLWVMEREWEPLPLGAVFLNLSANNYAGVTWPAIPATQKGSAFEPDFNSTSSTLADAWKMFQSFTSEQTRISFRNEPDVVGETWPINLPYIAFRPDGGVRVSGSGARIFDAAASSSRLVGLRVVEGRSLPESGEIVIDNPDGARFVEVHDITGRVVVRRREDYN